MIFAGSLEEDILGVFWEEGTPLNVLEVWDGLDEKDIQVPVLYLNKVLIAMTRVEILEKVGDRFGQLAYQPKEYQLPCIRKTIKKMLRQTQRG